MDKMKKNPILMGVLNFAGVAAGLLLLNFILSLIKKRSFAEQLSDPISLAILIIGPIACAISGYLKAKRELTETKQKKNN